MTNKPAPLTLGQRIVTALGNPNASASELSELVAETELAIVTADETVSSERADAADLISTPSAEAAQAAISRADAAQINRDRLRSALPKLREKLSAALVEEAKERWLADYKRVRQQLDNAATLFGSYIEHAEAIVRLFAVAAEVDKEVSRINGSAPDGVHLRLRSVELEARNLDRFSLDDPSLAATVELRDWNHSGQKLWPVQNPNSFAAEFASSMVVPPHPGAHWADPEVVARRRQEAEREQQRIGEFYEQQTAAQEQRQNAEEKERFARRG
jgi:hypothetical protein